MDKYDADMVLEDLVKAYGASNPLVIGRGSRDTPTAYVNPSSVPTNDGPKRARRMTPSEIPASKLMDSIVEITESEDEQEGRRTVRTSTNRSQRDKSKTRRSVSKNGRTKAPNDEDDIIGKYYSIFCFLSTTMVIVLIYRLLYYFFPLIFTIWNI